MVTVFLFPQGKYKSNVNSLYSQYEAARNSTEKEEKRALQQQGVNIQERVFTAEEVIRGRGN